MSQTFRLGSLNHVHLVVADRAAAARWYCERLGFQPIAAYASWAQVDGGPLHLSADGGRSGIALFQASEGHPAKTLELGVAFAVDAAQFIRFAQDLTVCPLRNLAGGVLIADAVVDFDHCYAYNFLDPWDNRLELDCYDTQSVRAKLIDAYGITPQRYW